MTSGQPREEIIVFLTHNFIVSLTFTDQVSKTARYGVFGLKIIFKGLVPIRIAKRRNLNGFRILEKASTYEQKKDFDFRCLEE